MSRLQDRVIVITGASSGIGRATALRCAEAGMDVVINARRRDRLESLATEIKDRGRRAVIVEADVIDADASERMLDIAHHELGRLDAVFSNAGYGFDAPMIDVTEDDLRKIFDVNFFASVELIRAAAHRFIEQRHPGHLLMCSSCLAKFTLPGHGAYSATKAAQNHICRAMGIELREHGISVSSVHPITTVTEFFEVAQRMSGNEVAAGQAVADHAPKLFVQSADRVGRAIVRCLERPRPEVWTSHIVRGTAAAMTFFPRFADLIMRKTDS